MQMGIVIIELCQLNRGGAAAQYGTLAELRGSGTIEQDAKRSCYGAHITARRGRTARHQRLPGYRHHDRQKSGRRSWRGAHAVRPQYHDWIPDGDIYQQDEGGESGPKFESYEQQQM